MRAIGFRPLSVYEELGVRPLINAWGTVTTVGGSLMAPEVLEASTAFVDLHTLQRRAGERIASLLGAAELPPRSNIPRYLGDSADLLGL